MPEVLNIPIVESTTSRYKPSNLTRVASIVVCFLFAALISTLTVRYFSDVTPIPTQVQEVAEQRQSRIPSIFERMDALHSKVSELERTLEAITRKEHLAWNNQQTKNLLFPRRTQPFATTEANIPTVTISDVAATSMLIIEQQLAVVLRAGERLGISPEAILEHLRIQNGDG
uniref:Uncharacterized protein n=1 Tax=Meloidogyne floridensis TaxID=298350 RepID=A0A915NXJ2_9BILA